MYKCMYCYYCNGDLCKEHPLCSSTMKYQCVVIFLVLQKQFDADVYIYVYIRTEVECCLKVRTLPYGFNIS